MATAPVVEGWLWKKGDVGIVKGFKRRWFRVVGDKILYAEDANKISSDPSGSIEIPAIVSFTVNDSHANKKDRPGRGFELAAMSGRVYMLVADNDVELQKWQSFIDNYLASRKWNWDKKDPASKDQPKEKEKGGDFLVEDSDSSSEKEKKPKSPRAEKEIEKEKESAPAAAPAPEPKPVVTLAPAVIAATSTHNARHSGVTRFGDTKASIKQPQPAASAPVAAPSSTSSTTASSTSSSMPSEVEVLQRDNVHLKEKLRSAFEESSAKEHKVTALTKKLSDLEKDVDAKNVSESLAVAVIDNLIQDLNATFPGTDKKDGPQETESNIVFVAKRLAAQIKRIPSAKISEKSQRMTSELDAALIAKKPGEGFAVQAAEKEAEVEALKVRVSALSEENSSLVAESDTNRLHAANALANVTVTIAELQVEIAKKDNELAAFAAYSASLQANVAETIQRLLDENAKLKAEAQK